MKSRDSSFRAILVAWAIAAVCFVPWFAWLTSRGQLPGNTDTWLAIALAEDTWVRFTAWVRGLPSPPSAMFPVERVLDYGEPGLFWQIVYGSLRLLTDDLVALWNTAGCMMAIGNVIAVAFLAGTLGVGSAGAVAAGLFFSVWGFWFANIDDITYHFYAVTAAAIGWSRIAMGRGDSRTFLISGLLIGLNAWISVYVYVMSALAWFCVLVLDGRGGRVSMRHAALAGFAAVIPALPVALEMVRRYLTLEVVNPFNPSDFDVFLVAARNTSVHLQDFLRPVRGSLLIPDFVGSDQSVAWSHLRRAAWPGLVFSFFWGTGALRLVRRDGTEFPTKALLAIWVVFIVIAAGPYLEFPGVRLPMPMLVVYTAIEAAQFFRVPLRALTAAHLAASLIAGAGAQKVWNTLSVYGKGWAAVVATSAMLLQVLEHQPLPPVGYPARDYMEPPRALAQCIEALPDDAVLAFLPSSMDLVFYQDDAALYPYNREMIYMLWQIRFGRASVNGANGYIPPSRVEVDRILRALPREQGIRRLQQFGATHLVLVDDFAVHPREVAQLERMRGVLSRARGCGSESATVYSLASLIASGGAN